MMIAPYPSCAWSLALCWLALGLAGVCRAVDVTLAWDPNSEADVSGYVVAMGTNDGGPYPQRLGYHHIHFLFCIVLTERETYRNKIGVIINSLDNMGTLVGATAAGAAAGYA